MENSNDLTVAAPAALVPALAAGPLENLFAPGAAYYALWPIDTPSDKALVQRCLAGEDGRIEEEIGKVIHISRALVQAVEIGDDKTGEIVYGVRTVLISPEGFRYAATSRGVVSCLRYLASLYPVIPWVPPLPLMVCQVPTRKGRRTFKLELDQEYGQAAPATGREAAHGKTKKS